MKIFISFVLFGVLSSCTRTVIKSPHEAMRLATQAPTIVDTHSRESFFSTLRAHIDVMKKSGLVKEQMIFGETKISKAHYVSALEEIFKHEADYVQYIQDNFDSYEVYGKEEWGEILSTGYYEPHVSGSRTPNEKHSQAVYARPNDLVTVNLKSFAYKFSVPLEHQSVRGRLKGSTVIPYYVRSEIDSDLKLQGQNLELAYLDPIDAFFIQIQGSGVIDFSDGTNMRIGYAEQNGHPYVALGKHLTHVIPIEEMSMQRIRNHLETLTPPERQKILNLNPSYVFFRLLNSQALTYAGMEVSAGRTIETDKDLMPKGALAFLQIEEPVFESTSSTVPVAWLNQPRLVFDQDTGGAIRGPGRVDLYFGSTPEAAQKAGVMKRSGKLFYLVPKAKL